MVFVIAISTQSPMRGSSIVPVRAGCPVFCLWNCTAVSLAVKGEFRSRSSSASQGFSCGRRMGVQPGRSLPNWRLITAEGVFWGLQTPRSAPKKPNNLPLVCQNGPENWLAHFGRSGRGFTFGNARAGGDRFRTGEAP
jgi:hypothetical protein